MNTNRKSTMRFPMSLRWSSYVAPKSPKGGLKNAENGRFQCKITLCLKKICYKVPLCENCQRQTFKAFIGLSIRAKMIGGGGPFHVKIWRILTQPLQIASAVTPSKKVQLTLIGSPLRAFQW